jgi:hypothetical protein
MSPIFFVAPFSALLASLCIWGLFRVVGRWSGKSGPSRASGCAVAAIAFPMLSVFFFVWLPRATTYAGEGVTAQVANDNLLTISVPETATDVNFRHAFYSSLIDEADFEITEDDFLKWVKEQRWTTREFGTNADRIHGEPESEFSADDLAWVYPVAISGDAEMIEVRNGYEIVDDGAIENDDVFLCVVYDKDHDRAYMWRTTF